MPYKRVGMTAMKVAEDFICGIKGLLRKEWDRGDIEKMRRADDDHISLTLYWCFSAFDKVSFANGTI